MPNQVPFANPNIQQSGSNAKNGLDGQSNESWSISIAPAHSGDPSPPNTFVAPNGEAHKGQGRE